VLFGFYVLFYLFSKEYINLLIAAYFALFGTIAVFTMLDRLLREYILPSSLIPKKSIHLSAKSEDKEYFSFHLDALNGSLIVLSIAHTAYYVLTKNWIANNIIGEAFASNAIVLLDIDSFKAGMILLAGLFVYDIFWVFGTDVM
jgi:minor histocompatibility antigen H13